MSRELVRSYNEVVETVRAFNRGLEENEGFRNRLPYYRVWYYIPELDMVGPSKFVGYRGMTATEYVQAYSELDGRETEPVLWRFFEEVDPNEGDRRREGTYVRRLVENLLGRYDKMPNRKARYSAPEEWTLPENGEAPRHSDARTLTNVGHSQSMVEVFWRAFLTLYPDDQKALAQRIADHLGRR